VVKYKEIILVLGNKSEELTKKRVELAESKVSKLRKFKVIFSGTKEEINWMKKHSKLNAVIEDKSSTTPENLMNSKKLIGDAEKVIIITDQSHAFRTRYLASIILKGKTIEVVGVKMPFIFLLKQIYYEFPRLIKHIYELG
jgi:uncharacterized SAM-binding protein YcdF (DUF218 family)